MTATNTKDVQGAPPRLLRVPEAADALGVSRGTVYNLVADGLLGTVSVRGLTRISEAEIARFIRANTTAARKTR